MTNFTQEKEDREFACEYRDAKGNLDYEWMARVLSGRLRQMDKRAKAANIRADKAEAELNRLHDIEVTYDQIKRIALSQWWDDEFNSLEDPGEFASDLWKAGVLDILRPRTEK